MSLPNCFGYNGRLFIRTVLIYIYPVNMYTSVSECNHGTLLDSYLFVIVGATLQNILLQSCFD